MSIKIRLMTGNFLGDSADPIALKEMIERIQPDILLAQELGPETALVISDVYPHHFLDPSLDYSGRGVASQFPGRFDTLPLPRRSGTMAEFDLDGHCLIVAGVHMINPVAFPWWRRPQQRQEQLDALIAWATVQDQRCESLVVAGDLNASPIWPAYRQIADRWEDLAQSAAGSLGMRPAPTWAWRPGLPRLLRIDHVFGTGARSTSTRVESIVGSDHAALIVDLVIG